MTHQPLAPDVSLAGRQILIAEDEPLLALEMIEELDDLGVVSIGPIPSVEEALSVIGRRERIDAALINVHLRGKLSCAVADALIERSIPFLFVTGNDGFVREHYPNVPSHPKPSDIAAIVAALHLLVTKSEKD